MGEGNCIKNWIVCVYTICESVDGEGEGIKGGGGND